MSIIPCVSWVRLLWEKLFGYMDQNSSIDLPYEIIVDILSRLPAECLFRCAHACKPFSALTMSPSFIEMHMNRTAPIFAFQHYYIYNTPRPQNNGVEDVNVYFSSEVTGKIITKSIRIDLSHACHDTHCLACLYGSYNGFLIFRNFCHISVLFIWNPITQEQVSVIGPSRKYQLGGMFFHPVANEYMVIFVSWTGKLFEYIILGLRTECFRSLGYSYPPFTARNPVILNDVLHWTVGVKSYKQAYGVFPSCSQSILLFNINSSEFSTMSHPGGRCWERNPFRSKHSAMELMVNEGNLWLCDNSFRKVTIIWVLKDYEKRVWVKQHIIEHFKLFPNLDLDLEKYPLVKALYFFGNKNEVLFCGPPESQLFLYDVENNIRSIVKKRHPDQRYSVSAVCHVNTLARLGSKNRVYLRNLGMGVQYI